MKTKKAKGFMLLPAVLMSILLGLLGLSFLQIFSGQFTAMSSGRKAIQALQFAQSEADYLRNVDYSSLSGHARQAISGANGWQSQVSIGSESVVGGVKQRMATVNVYRNNSINTPDFSLQVPLSSAGGGGNAGDTFPVGTILAYKGAIANIPEKWHLCDGSSGTPNLTGRFLEGVTASPGNMKSAGLPNITGNAPDVRIRCGNRTVMAGALKSWQSTGKKLIYNGGAETAGMDFDFDASRCSSVYRNDCTTVQPASYTVLYIMKIKA